MLSERVRPGRSGLRAALIAAGIGVFASTGASAATVVTSWGFELDAGFTAFTDENSGGTHPVTGSNPNALLTSPGVSIPSLDPCSPVIGSCVANPITGAPFASAPSKLSWGVPISEGNNNQSSIEIGFSNGHFDSSTDGGPLNNMNTPITTGGGEVATVKATHNNWAVGLNQGELDTATLTDVLTLKPLAPAQAGPPVIPGVAFFAPQITFSIDFEETLNSNTGASCPQGGNATGCSDVFVFDVTGAGFSIIADGPDADSEPDIVLDQMFSFDTGDGAVQYNARIRLEGLQELTNAECQIANVSIVGTCIGLITLENQINSFQTFLSIQAKQQEVSEPGTLALLGLGLLGLGYVRRRRHA